MITLNDTPATTIFDAYGRARNGERLAASSLTAPTDFPSGFGGAGGTFNFNFINLPGDINLDNRVDGTDMLLWQLMPKGGTDRTFTEGDGDVDGDDFYILNIENSGLVFTSW